MNTEALFGFVKVKNPERILSICNTEIDVIQAEMDEAWEKELKRIQEDNGFWNNPFRFYIRHKLTGKVKSIEECKTAMAETLDPWHRLEFMSDMRSSQKENATRIWNTIKSGMRDGGETYLNSELLIWVDVWEIKQKERAEKKLDSPKESC